MISVDEVKNLSLTQGVNVVQIEKDYAMGWLLWGISNTPALDRQLILKGGSCLRKMYFADTRFSDDLDFTTRSQINANDFEDVTNSVLRMVSKASGLEFILDRTSVKEKPTPQEDTSALDARVYFKGFAGDSSLDFRIKFDVSPYEKVVLPIQRHQVIHSFSDSGICQSQIYAYSLEEVLAEKLRSWIQRTSTPRLK